MAQINDAIRICPRCGSVNLRQNPPIWEQKQNEVVVCKCMTCSYQGRDFPLIKKAQVKQFRDKLKNK